MTRRMAAFLTRLLAVLHDRELVEPLAPFRCTATSTRSTAPVRRHVTVTALPVGLTYG